MTGNNIVVPVQTGMGRMEDRKIPVAWENDVFAIHTTPGGDGWTVTHRTSGLAVLQGFVCKLATIIRIVKVLTARYPVFGRIRTGIYDLPAPDRDRLRAAVRRARRYLIEKGGEHD